MENRPETGTEVYLITEYGNGIGVLKASGEWQMVTFDGTFNLEDSDIIAWHELPEEWK